MFPTFWVFCTVNVFSSLYSEKTNNSFLSHMKMDFFLRKTIIFQKVLNFIEKNLFFAIKSWGRLLKVSENITHNKKAVCREIWTGHLLVK